VLDGGANSVSTPKLNKSHRNFDAALASARGANYVSSVHFNQKQELKLLEEHRPRGPTNKIDQPRQEGQEQFRVFFVKT
jgi:hypothetical protein